MNQSPKLMPMTMKFRDKFVLNHTINNWFPGHMFKGLCNLNRHLDFILILFVSITGIKEMNKKLHRIDCIIEVHDARVPFTGRNTKFQKQLSEIRPHYLLLNKVDLCDQSSNEIVIDKIKNEENIQKVIYTNLKTSNQIHNILPDVMNMVRKSERYQRSNRAEINLMVTGIPNVGKSTFINRIINLYVKGRGTIAKQGSSPGVTRSVQERIKILTHPLVYIFDTPGIFKLIFWIKIHLNLFYVKSTGILEPRFENPIEDPLKLAACDLLPSHVIGKDVVADYILFWLNKNSRFEYVEVLKLDEPIDNIDDLLAKICIKNNLFVKKRDIKSKLSFKNSEMI